MKIHFHAALLALLVALALLTRATGAEIAVYFSPDGGAAAAVVEEISLAKSTIKVAAYAISEPNITRALLAAQERGVFVSIIVTPTQQSDAYSTAGKLKKAGIPTHVDHEHALMHNKTMVIDNSVVVTGSMNFTTAGDKKNAENTLIIHDAAMAALYTANWYSHLEHSGVFKPSHSKDYRPPKPPPHLIIPPRRAHR